MRVPLFCLIQLKLVDRVESKIFWSTIFDMNLRPSKAQLQVLAAAVPAVLQMLLVKKKLGRSKEKSAFWNLPVGVTPFLGHRCRTFLLWMVTHPIPNYFSTCDSSHAQPYPKSQKDHDSWVMLWKGQCTGWDYHERHNIASTLGRNELKHFHSTCPWESKNMILVSACGSWSS